VSANADLASGPVLSVVVVVFAGGSAVTRALEALDHQEGVTGRVEVIVAAAAGTIDEGTLRAVSPAARFVSGPVAAHPSQLRALGVRAASAPIVACTEDHCIATPDWCARIVAAHRGPALVIGGAIQKLRPDSSIAWTAYLLEYGRFMPPIASGPATYLSDCNVSYKRVALEQIADAWHGAFHETRVHERIKARAGASALVQDASIVVLQSRRADLMPFLGERFAHGRLFARLRAAQYGALERVAYGAGALGLAPVLVLRAFRSAWRRPDARTSAVRALPYLVLAATCWSVGESVGALTTKNEA
jgi:hypothetical protein